MIEVRFWDVSAMRYAIFLAAAIPVIAACSSTPEQQPVASADPLNELVCVREVPTGSHMPKRVCRYRSEMEAESDRVVDMLEDRMRDKVPLGGARKPGGTGSND